MNLFLTILCLACVLQASYACSCEPVTFEEAFCQGPTMGKFFLIQAEVTAMSRPLYLDYMSPDMQEFYAYRRYELAVTETYRDNTGLVKPVTVLKAAINDGLCGIKLKVGKTYVIAGTAFVNAAGQEELTTDFCQYNRRYNTAVDVELPDCQNDRYQAGSARNPPWPPRPGK